MSRDLIKRFVHELLHDIKVNRITLPTLPEVANKIRTMVDNPNASANDLYDTLKLDVALSARLLKLANSPLFRVRKSIEDLNTAITRLGNRNIKNLVTNLVLEQMFQSECYSPEVQNKLKAQWKYNLRIAAISYFLAKNYTSLNADEAMMAGLIHDIGTLPIIEYAESIPELSSNPAALEMLVNKLHTNIGRLILKKWRFPESLITVASEHEDLFRNPGVNLDYTDIIIIANFLAQIGTDHPSTKLDWNTIPAFNRISISPENCISAIKNAQDELMQIQQTFSR
ncbi:MAG: HDOD domain-containing protein [Gammaproteobacteria bacterium]|nr:HDOD domain-containing protein [Gammaproteobacteria bacterium]